MQLIDGHLSACKQTTFLCKTGLKWGFKKMGYAMKLSEVFEKYLVLNICTKLDLKK